MPILNYEIQPLFSRRTLYKACKQMGINANYIEIMMAFEQAQNTHKENQKKLMKSGKHAIETRKEAVRNNKYGNNSYGDDEDDY